MDNNTQSPEPGNVPEYSVSELSFALKKTVEGAYSRVRVRGEISGFKRAASGHLYMALKDDRANLDAVCWRGIAGRLRFAPEDGLEVVCSGRLSTYPARSRYQLVIDEMEPAGAGALMALLEERRKKLAAEGLFDAGRKKPIPFLPEVIGVVTSPTGAVIRDILHRLADRFPRHVLLWPVLVQGEGAAAQIAAAVRGFNRISGDGTLPRPDLLIVARGGGSLEDLWAFNEEVVVRAVAEGAIPLISAVGHETDTTLVDYAADMRAPTPTGAAEMAVPVRRDLLATVADLERRLERAVRRGLNERRRDAGALARALPRPRDLLALAGQRTDDLGERLPRALEASVAGRRGRFLEVAGGLRPTVLRHNLGTAGQALASLGRRLRPAIVSRQSAGRQTLDGLSRMLESLGYRQVLARGYAVVRAAGGAMLARAAVVRPGAGLDIEFADGHVAAVAGHGVRRKKPAQGPADEQGTLL